MPSLRLPPPWYAGCLSQFISRLLPYNKSSRVEDEFQAVKSQVEQSLDPEAATRYTHGQDADVGLKIGILLSADSNSQIWVEIAQ